MSQTPLLTLTDISKRFGYRTVFKNINLEVFPGENVLLLGSNGAGKSTLLRIIATLSRPTTGNIIFKSVEHRKQLKTFLKSIGCLSHASRLYGDLTAIENLRLWGTLYEVSDLKFHIPQVLEMVELGHAANLRVRTFSTGMTKRLMIARILLYQPELLLLDEPYSGLDPHFVRIFQQFLKSHHDKGGTILLVTHQLELGLELATRGILLEQKQIQQDLSSDQLSLERCSQWLDPY